MKNSLKIIIGLSIVFLSSCSKEFLDKQNPNQLGEGNFYKTEKQFDQAITGIYGQLQGIIGSQWLFTEMITDNTTVHFNEGNRGNAPTFESFEYWQVNANTGNIYQLYRDTYNVLGNINLTLSRLQEADIDAAAKTNFEGQLRFFRAYYYFLLSQYFGDVILMTEPLRDPSTAFEFQRSPVADVLALVESDLAVAVSNLPVQADASKKGALTKGAALTLSGLVALTRKDYAKAKDYLEQVKGLGIYSLLPEYADVFNPANKNNAESIFEVQFQGGNDPNNESSGFIYNFYPLFTNGEVTGFPGVSGGGWNIPTKDIINDYEAGDKRKTVSVSEGYTSNVTNQFVPVPFIEKFHHNHAVQGRPDDDWPIFRYADALLMLAEAINEQSGPDNEAYGYLNQVRARAGLSPLSNLSQADFKTALLHERRVELAFENHRWFDLRRFLTDAQLVALLNAHGQEEKTSPTTSRGTIPFSAGDYQFEAYEILFPIPAREILVNPKLTQNLGY